MRRLENEMQRCMQTVSDEDYSDSWDGSGKE